MWHTLCNLNKLNFISFTPRITRLSISNCISLTKIQIAVKIRHGVHPSKAENPVLRVR